MANALISPIAASLLILGLAASPALAESHSAKKNSHGTMNHSTMNHDQMGKSEDANEARPTEGGQAAFATIAEIVELLNNDPKTDWSKVNIDGLREHLIDMDEVTMRAKATAAVSGNTIIFTVTGEGRTKQAIQAMVPAHAAVLARITDWESKGVATDTGATLTVHAANAHELHKLKALGFFGIMATGAHHQAHHFAMAKGDSNVHSHN
ncbi:MAG: hypothetical protein V3V02_01055 [Rhizobiaceae bacterium]